MLAAAERDLRTVSGLGTHSIAAVKLLHAAAVRLARAGVIGRPVLDGWEELIAYLTAVMARGAHRAVPHPFPSTPRTACARTRHRPAVP